jgi:hypothetical protein
MIMGRSDTPTASIEMGGVFTVVKSARDSPPVTTKTSVPTGILNPHSLGDRREDESNSGFIRVNSAGLVFDLAAERHPVSGICPRGS